MNLALILLGIIIFGTGLFVVSTVMYLRQLWDRWEREWETEAYRGL